MSRTNNNAVSPVVGVMLMLVVTIIIAAIVSAFAGGLTQTNNKAPNVQIKAYYSQADGMWIENDGPDVVSTMSTDVWVRCSDSFANAQHMAWEVNKSSIAANNATNPLDGDLWVTSGGYNGAQAFKPGDRDYIAPPYQTGPFLQPGASATYRFDSTANLGKTFWVEMTDKTGKIFAKTLVTIQS